MPFLSDRNALVQQGSQVALDRPALRDYLHRLALSSLEFDMTAIDDKGNVDFIIEDDTSSVEIGRPQNDLYPITYTESVAAGTVYEVDRAHGPIVGDQETRFARLKFSTHPADNNPNDAVITHRRLPLAQLRRFIERSRDAGNIPSTLTSYDASDQSGLVWAVEGDVEFSLASNDHAPASESAQHQVVIRNSHADIEFVGLDSRRVLIVTTDGNLEIRNDHVNDGFSDETPKYDVRDGHGSITLFRVQPPVSIIDRVGSIDVDQSRAVIVQNHGDGIDKVTLVCARGGISGVSRERIVDEGGTSPEFEIR